MQVTASFLGILTASAVLLISVPSLAFGQQDHQMNMDENVTASTNATSTGLPMNYADEERVHPNVGYLIQYGSLSVLHLGDLAHVPDQSTIEALGEVNVVLVPVGGGSALRASTAAEVIALIEPNYIVPMHYMLPGLTTLLDPVDKFLKEMGISRAMQEEDILKVTSGSLPEQPQVILLRPQINGGG